MAEQQVPALIRSHLQRYSEIDIMDIYRMLHQAVFGPGKKIIAENVEREYLERETDGLRHDANALLLENIHPEGVIVRLHLRPYLAMRGNLRTLLAAYIETSAVVRGSEETMAAWWGIFQRMTGPGEMLANRFDARTVSLIGRTRASERWSAAHHSPPFLQNYKPAYRVLTARIAEELLSKQGITAKIG
jgi:hypothetical protein